jgi:hypothetical protein
VNITKITPPTIRPTSTPSISGMNTLPQIDIKKISNSAASSAQGLVKSVSASTGIGSGKLTPEQQRRIAKDDAERKKIIQRGQQRRDAEKNVRSEYLKILKDQSHPLYDQVAFGDLTLDKFKQQYQSPAAATPAAVGPRFADLRGSATPGRNCSRWYQVMLQEVVMQHQKESIILLPTKKHMEVKMMHWQQKNLE